MCARQPAVTQQNRVRVRLENIPDITDMMEGGERKLGLLLLLKWQHEVWFEKTRVRFNKTSTVTVMTLTQSLTQLSLTQD